MALTVRYVFAHNLKLLLGFYICYSINFVMQIESHEQHFKNTRVCIVI